jgi:hypothetical protein
MLLKRGRVFKNPRQQNRQRAQADCFWADMYNIATLRNNKRIWTSSGGGLPGFHDDNMWKDRSYFFFGVKEAQPGESLQQVCFAQRKIAMMK